MSVAAGGSLSLDGPVLLDGPESASVEAGRFGQDIGAILLLVTMAAPPTHSLAFLNLFGKTPLVIWAVQRSSVIRNGFDASDITSGGTAVGTPQITNMLSRSGRPFELVVGPLEQETTHRSLARLLRLGAVAGEIRRARVIRLGAARRLRLRGR